MDDSSFAVDIAQSVGMAMHIEQDEVPAIITNVCIDDVCHCDIGCAKPLFPESTQQKRRLREGLVAYSGEGAYPGF